MTERSQGRAFILPLCIALMFVLMTLALAVAQMSLAHHGFTELVESDAQEEEAAEVGFANFQAILSGNSPPTVMGLEDLPSAGPSVQPAFAPDPPYQPATVSGQFNLGFPTVAGGGSFFRPPPPEATGLTTIPASDGYGSALNGTEPIPARHLLSVLTAREGTAPASQYFAVFTSAYPYGLLAHTGSIQIGQARSVDDVAGTDDEESGVPVSLWGNLSVDVQTFLNGSAMTDTGDIHLATGGLVVPHIPAPDFPPPDFTTDLNAANVAMGGASDLGSQISTMQGLLNFNLGGVGIVPLITAPGGTNANGGTFNVGTSFKVIGAVHVPMSMKVAAHLIIPDGTVLVVNGNLDVGGNIYMGTPGSAKCSLIVRGALSVPNGTLCTLASQPPAPTDSEAIGTTVLVSGPVTLPGGMTHSATPVIDGGTSFGAAPNPFPASGMGDANSEYSAFAEAQAAALGVVSQLNGPVTFLPGGQNVTVLPPSIPLGNMLVTVATTPDEDSNLMGIAMVADGDITIGGQAEGLWVSQTGSLVGNGAGHELTRLVGAAWAAGNITAQAASFRYFPYYTHFFALTPDGSAIQVAATHYHRIAYGRMQQ